MSKHHSELSLSEVHESVDTTASHKPKWRRILAFFGPAYLVSVGYMDPGNWATDLAGGSRFGYSLLWVLLMSNLMALLLQSLASRLGIVRHKDLAQANREAYPRGINFILYLLAEIAIAATDLAEVVGMAIGLQLLFGLPLMYGVLITVLDTFLLMLLQRFGMRRLEAFVIGLIFIIAMSFFIQLMVARPDIKEVATGFVPRLENDAALYIAIGIIGATVMPHNLYLHSALVQTRKFKNTGDGIKKALKYNFWDSAVALNMAFLVNAAILILAATVFFKTGRTDVAEIKQAYELLPGRLGSEITSKLFAVALIAAGQSSTVTGTLAGQIIMEGYLKLRINPLVRRLLTRLIAIIPAVLVIAFYGEGEINQLLILSQVVLSMQLGFAIIPLIHFVSDKKTMGQFAITTTTKVAAWLITAVLLYLNSKMVADEISAFFTADVSLFWKLIVITGTAGLIVLLGYTIYYPFSKRSKRASSSPVHPEPAQLDLSDGLRSHDVIAIAVDFGKNDSRLIAQALKQGSPATKFVLIHIVESVAARFNNKEIKDQESKTDKIYLDNYAKQIRQHGFKVVWELGYGSASREIPGIVKRLNASLLVMGAHGHKAIKDFIYGSTINNVRHNVKIPILIINNDEHPVSRSE
ncbi:iron/manganese transporter [Niabella ginsenosidivorans]|uniref:Divalent metal cation transporter MntH n=1 Tax=Niabella ginsenosidivorans TaxID=1176587 RepID=A0A1A9I2P6_9BACT|nr:Nramp family divalent metal transporter [Niabella ginsenosidivorans]ANH81803.1 iron/manganese transporter [Niabella ginsenosidivorans]